MASTKIENENENDISTKKAGRPKTIKVDKKQYMKEYMRDYYKKNNKQELQRRVNQYSLSKGMPKQYVEDYKHHAHILFKLENLISEVRQKCPEHLDKFLV